MLVRRWGILWKPLECRFNRCANFKFLLLQCILLYV